MYYNIINQDFYSNRLEAKKAVGGISSFNKMFRHHEIIFINDDIYRRLKDFFENNNANII